MSPLLIGSILLMLGFAKVHKDPDAALPMICGGVVLFAVCFSK